MKLLQYITIILFALASAFFGCRQTNKTIPVTNWTESPPAESPSMVRFFKFSDSFNLNLHKSDMMRVKGKRDSANYYYGKAAAYYEMERNGTK